MANDKNITFGEKVSDLVAKFGGSWLFIFIAVFIIVAWISLNSLAMFGFIAWDQYPYILLNLLLSFVAAFQAPFIMMSQGRVERKQDLVYRQFFTEIKELVKRDVLLEKKIMKEIAEIKKILTGSNNNTDRFP